MKYEMLVKMLKEEESVEEKPYVDSVGKITIGVGRNLTDKGLRQREIDYLLDNDIAEVNMDLSKNLIYLKLDPIRQTVLFDMCFNLGYSRLKQFKSMFRALENKDYDKAAEEMLDSQWARQVGRRAIRLSKMMKTGEYHDL